jgi:hypothetical protein
MSIGTEIVGRTRKTIQDKLEQIEFFQDEIVKVDDQKSLYDQAIFRLDNDLLGEIQIVNRALDDVKDAYQDRISVGCRTDLFWRVTGYNPTPTPDQYTFTCTKLSAGGYEQVGIGSTVRMLNPATDSIVDFPINTYWDEQTGQPQASYFGFDPRNFYGLKYYDEPYSLDIGDTFVTAFIGTMALGGTTVTVMQPVGAGTSEVLEVGDIISANKDGVFNATTKITGITTGLVDLRNSPNNVGIASTLQFVNILTVDNASGAAVESPEPDGTFVTFRVIGDPDDVVDTGRKKYALPYKADGTSDWNKDPYLMQDVGIMKTDTCGVGVSIAVDNSGAPDGVQDWNPNLYGWVVEYDDKGEPAAGPVQPPNVGSGRCFWPVGFSTRPIMGGGGAAEEGDIRTGIEPGDFAGLYQDLPTCATEDATVNTLIGISSTKEQEISGQGTNRVNKVRAVNGLRIERNELNIRIWSMRQGISKLNDEYDDLVDLEAYIGITTVKNLLDE